MAIVAPASPFAREEFDGGVAELRALGFDPVFDDRVFARRGYVAGEPEVRAAAFLEAWNAPDISALIAVRGGYGSVQILPLLDGHLDPVPKLFIGYSDVTSLHTVLTLHHRIVTIHGPMLEGRLASGPERYDRESFLKVLARPEPAGELRAPLLETLNPGEAAGPVFGGTLSQLLASLGTPFAFDPPVGHVLFVDEVGERPFRIDRMLTQMQLSGVLRRAAAVVFGELPRCDEPAGAPTAKSVIADLMHDFPGPVLFGLPSGHSVSPTVTLPLGVRARVVATNTPRFIVEEAAVESA